MPKTHVVLTHKSLYLFHSDFFMVFSFTTGNDYLIYHSFRLVIYAIVRLFISVEIMRLKEICYTGMIQKESNP